MTLKSDSLNGFEGYRLGLKGFQDARCLEVFGDRLFDFQQGFGSIE